jgi:aryl-alcohol dehydrogenase-like predicted oxidoreductase
LIKDGITRIVNRLEEESLGACWTTEATPCCSGYLAQRLDAQTEFDLKSDLRSGFDRFKPESITANEPFVDRITELAKRKDATTAQLSLAWRLAQKPFIVPIPGTGNVKHLQENIESTKLVLTAEDLKEIASALAGLKVHGGRMNEEQMWVVDQTV